jgi:hypothetical protein
MPPGSISAESIAALEIGCSGSVVFFLNLAGGMVTVCVSSSLFSITNTR